VTLTGRSLDTGSSSAYDPFLQYNFDTAGTYQIKVGSYRNSLDGYVASGVQGVASGLNYQLNVGLPNQHDQRQPGRLGRQDHHRH